MPLTYLAFLRVTERPLIIFVAYSARNLFIFSRF